jgi:hypothetical protein
MLGRWSAAGEPQLNVGHRLAKAKPGLAKAKSIPTYAKHKAKAESIVVVAGHG